MNCLLMIEYRGEWLDSYEVCQNILPINKGLLDGIRLPGYKLRLLFNAVK